MRVLIGLGLWGLVLAAVAGPAQFSPVLRQNQAFPLSYQQGDANMSNAAAVMNAANAKLVTVTDFGAVPNDSRDDSAAFQAALNSGYNAVFVPQGSYIVGGLVMPARVGFEFYGEGAASILKQTSGSGELLSWPTATLLWGPVKIRDLALDGTNGTGNLIDTSGMGGLLLDRLTINNIPTGYSGIYVNGAAATATHDVHISNVLMYTTTAGFAGVRFGPLANDSYLDGFIINGNFAANYGIYFDAGAKSIGVSASHPYNVTLNTAKLSGANQWVTFDNVVFDNAQADLVSVVGGGEISFTSCYFETINNGFSGVKLASSTNTSFYNNLWEAGGTTAASAVTDDSASSYTSVIGGSISTLVDYAAPFNLSGSGSYVTNIPGITGTRFSYAFSGSTVTAQAQNTSQYLGVNGGQASVNQTAFVVPVANSLLLNVSVATDVTPAAGQNFTFNVLHNSNSIGSIVISNTQYSGVLSPKLALSAGDVLVLQSVFSATSGSANVRYSAAFGG